MHSCTHNYAMDFKTLLIKHNYPPPFHRNPSRVQVSTAPSSPPQQQRMLPKHPHPQTRAARTSLVGRDFFLVLKKLRTFFKISIPPSVLGKKRHCSLGKYFSFLCICINRDKPVYSFLSNPQLHVISSEVFGDSFIQEVS